MIWLATIILYTGILAVGIPIGIWLGERGRDPYGGQHMFPEPTRDPNKPKVGVS